MSALAARLAAMASTMDGFPETASPHRNVLARLRAGALATAGRGLAIVSAAEATGLGVPVVSLGLALRGHDGSLDHGLQHAVRIAIAYLVSPAAPTRATAEEMFGHALGNGGPEVGKLAATVMKQLAVLPSRRAMLVEELANIIRDDVAEIAVGITALRPNATVELSRRYLGILFTILDAAGVGWLIENAGLFIDTDQVLDAIEWLDRNAPPPSAMAPALAQLDRDGEAIIVRAFDDVPLALLMPLARRVWPKERGGFVELHVTPTDLTTHGPEIAAAIKTAIGEDPA